MSRSDEDGFQDTTHQYEHLLTADNYRLLGVSSNCTKDELRKAYYRKQLEFHTDKGGDLTICQKINEAYKILSDDKSREKYDTERQEEGEGFDLNRSIKRSLPGGKKPSDIFREIFGKFEDLGESLNFKNNFYSFYATVLDEVPELVLPGNESFHCKTCSGNFHSKEEHDELILNPYLELFQLEDGSSIDLLEFLGSYYGGSFTCRIDPVPLLPGILLNKKWDHLSTYVKLLKELPPDKQALKKKLNSKEFVSKTPKALRDIICWCNLQKDVSPIFTRSMEYLEFGFSDASSSNLETLMALIAFMHVFYGVDDWNQIALAHFSVNCIASSLFFARAGQLLNKDGVEDVWLKLGWLIYEEYEDLELAVECFVLGACDLNEIAEQLIRKDFHEDGIAVFAKTKNLARLKELAISFKECKNDDNFQLYFSSFIRHALLNERISELVDALHQVLPKGIFFSAMKRLKHQKPEEFMRCPLIHEISGEQVMDTKGQEVETFLEVLGLLHLVKEDSKFSLQEAELINKLGQAALSKAIYDKEDGASSVSKILRVRATFPAARRVWNGQTNHGRIDLETLPNWYVALLYLIDGRVNGSLTSLQKAMEKAPTLAAKGVAEMFLDTEYHKEVLLQLNEEMRNFKHKIETTSAIDFAEFPLLLTNTSPETVCQFKELLDHFEHLKVIRLGELSLHRFRTAASQIETAFSYLDFCMTEIPPSTKAGVLSMSISYLLKEMQANSLELKTLFAYHQLIHVLALQIKEILDQSSCSLPIYSYFQRYVFSALLQANHLFTSRIDTQKNLGEHEIPDSSLSDYYVKLLKDSTSLKKLLPEGNKMYSALDITVLQHIGVSFLEKFIGEKLSFKSFSKTFPRFIYEYYAFEGIWNGWLEGMGLTFDTSREQSMKALVECRNWSMEQVEALMSWSFIRKTEEGWMDCSDTTLKFEERAYSRFYGIEVNERTGELNLLLANPDWSVWKSLKISKSPYRPTYHPLFTASCIHEIFTRKILYSSFTLEEPSDVGMHGLPIRSHPFQECQFKPQSICGTNYLATLLHADLLLKQITTGVEINAKSPFHLRDAGANFLANVPENVRKILASPSERKSLTDLNNQERAHRFWIEVTDVSFNVQEKGDLKRFEFGNVKVGVFTKPLKRGDGGQLIDDPENEREDSAEAEFAKDLTQNYNEVGAYFPVLLRLKELAKLSFARKLMEIVYAERVREMLKKDMKPEIRSKLQEIKRKIPSYPTCNSEKIEEILTETIRRNGFRAADVPYEEIQKARRKICDNLCEQDKEIKKSLMTALAEGYYVTKEDIEWPLIAYLQSCSLQRELDKLASLLEKGVKDKYRRISASLEKLGMKIPENEDQEDVTFCTNCKDKDPSICCSWVPAAFASKSTTRGQNAEHVEKLKCFEGNEETSNVGREYRVYGGVRMVPNQVHEKVRTGMWEKSVSGSSVMDGKNNEGSGSSGGSSSGNGGNGCSKPGPGKDPSQDRRRDEFSANQSHVYVYWKEGSDPKLSGKVGISSVPLNANGDSDRALRQCRAQERKNGEKYHCKVISLHNTRGDARGTEKENIAFTRALLKDPVVVAKRNLGSDFKAYPKENAKHVSEAAKEKLNKYLKECAVKYQRRTS